MLNKIIYTGLLFTVFGLSVKAQRNETIITNQGELYRLPNSLVSTHFDFVNTNEGTVINDGTLEINKNYQNLGLVGYTTHQPSALTVFKGTSQLLAGD